MGTVLPAIEEVSRLVRRERAARLRAEFEAHYDRSEAKGMVCVFLRAIAATGDVNGDSMSDSTSPLPAAPRRRTLAL